MRHRVARRLNLLVVDDDPSVARLIAQVLRRELADRVAVTMLTDPAEAIEWLDSECCDILISDIGMPQYDGHDLLRAAKRHNAWVQVIFVTGHSTWPRITQAVGEGANEYLLKPIDPVSVVALVSDACERFDRWQFAVLQTLDTATCCGWA